MAAEEATEEIRATNEIVVMDEEKWYEELILFKKQRVVKEDEFTIKDEVQRLLKEIKIAIEQIQESKFYAKLTEQIKSAKFENQLKKVFLGSSYSNLNMVIYSLGSLEFNFNSIYQLAIALLMKQDFSSWIGGIEAYDPVFSPSDVMVLKELGCEVLQVNERCRREVDKPTLFYMPFTNVYLVGDLLGANWCPSRINQLIVLTSSFNARSPLKRRSKTEFYGMSEDYIYAIGNYTKEILLECYGDAYTNIFYDFAFHFFEVDSQFDMTTLIPDDEGKLSERRSKRIRDRDMKEDADYLWLQKCAEAGFTRPFKEDEPIGDRLSYYYGACRGPRKYRCSSSHPPKGRIKLNFGGIISSHNGNNIAGFGGVCRSSDSKEPILVYKGSLGKANETIACVEALRFGLTELLKIPNVSRNLIVEGDNFKVIQWANKRHEHPEEICKSLNEVLSLLEEFQSVIYHIYEEANLVAINLAEEGAVSSNGPSYVHLLGQDYEGLEDVNRFFECLKLEDY